MAKTMYSLKLDPALRERLIRSGIPLRRAVEEGIKVFENRGELAIEPPTVLLEPLPGEATQQATPADVGTPPYYFFLDMAGASATIRKELDYWHDFPTHRHYIFDRYVKDGYTVQQLADWVRLTESGAWKASLDKAKLERENDSMIDVNLQHDVALNETQKARVLEIQADRSKDIVVPSTPMVVKPKEIDPTTL